MRKIWIIAFVFFGMMVNFAFAQLPEMHPGIFKHKVEEIKSFHHEYQKLDEAIKLCGTFSLSSNQVRLMAAVFKNDQERYRFAVSAFPNCIDKGNFYDVYDAFAYFSTAFRLHDFILAYQNGNLPNNQGQDAPVFPELNYPVWRTYAGPVNCQRPASEMEFLMMAREVYRQRSEMERFNVLKTTLDNRCFPVAQMMKFSSMLQNEQNRYTFLTNGFSNIYDLRNLPFLEQMFSHPDVRVRFQAFVQSHLPSPAPPQPAPCAVSSTEMDVIVADINLRTFNNSRLTLAKQIIEQKECLTAAQISRIVQTVDYEDSKLELAKFAWDFCVDKRNYYTVNNAFEYESSISELDAYIKGKH